MKRQKIIIVGAGGLAREIAWLLQGLNTAKPTYDFLGYVVSDLQSLTPRDSKKEILGDFAWLKNNRKKWDCLTLGIGTPALRLKVASELNALFPKLKWPVLIHPTAQVAESCELAGGTVVCANVMISVNIQIASHCLLNLGCFVGHETEMGPGCVVNPLSSISGGVKMGAGVLVGAGATILQYLSIGDNAKVGAGAVVTKNVSAGKTVVGVPAKARS
jgi:sugar O-acyltransferase (sialic acid O-acetyltransferase NeuD family)